MMTVLLERHRVVPKLSLKVTLSHSVHSSLEDLKAGWVDQFFPGKSEKESGNISCTKLKERISRRGGEKLLKLRISTLTLESHLFSLQSKTGGGFPGSVCSPGTPMAGFLRQWGWIAAPNKPTSSRGSQGSPAERQVETERTVNLFFVFNLGPAEAATQIWHWC